MDPHWIAWKRPVSPRGCPGSIIRASATTSEKATATVATQSRPRSGPDAPVATGNAQSPSSIVAVTALVAIR